MIENSLIQLLNENHFNRSIPFLISLDCDNTIVERKRSSHWISPRTLAAIREILTNPKFILVFNTGRDCTNFQPIQVAIGEPVNSIFVGGRIIQTKEILFADPKAILPKAFLQTLAYKMRVGEIPFLDVKHKLGNTFIILESEFAKPFLGHHRPADWYDSFQIDVIYASESNIEQILDNFPDIVRIEVPFFNLNNSKIVLKINANERLEEAFFDFLEYTNPDQNLMIVGAPTHPSRRLLRDQVASIRVMITNQLVNKGTGLKWLQSHHQIPDTNVIAIGDSAAPTANDVIIRRMIPQSLLLIPSDAEAEAKKEASLLIPPLTSMGVAQILEGLMKHFI